MLYSRILHHLDRFMMRQFGNRASLTKAFSGLEPIWLTTVGAKTGTVRTLPVLGIEDGKTIIVAAGNWGQNHNPGWYYNVRAHPEVTVRLRGHEAEFVARELDGEEREENWNKIISYYSGAVSYARGAHVRQIPVLILTPKD